MESLLQLLPSAHRECVEMLWVLRVDAHPAPFLVSFVSSRCLNGSVQILYFTLWLFINGGRCPLTLGDDRQARGRSPASGQLRSGFKSSRPRLYIVRFATLTFWRRPQVLDLTPLAPPCLCCLSLPARGWLDTQAHGASLCGTWHPWPRLSVNLFLQDSRTTGIASPAFTRACCRRSSTVSGVTAPGEAYGCGHVPGLQGLVLIPDAGRTSSLSSKSTDVFPL